MSKLNQQGTTMDHDPRLGTLIGEKYRVIRLLGQGGMAHVYEAENIALGKRVALKFISPGSLSPGAARRLLREARTASAIRSPHVVEVFDVGQTSDGGPYIVMELLEGETLGSRLRKMGPLPQRTAVRIAHEMLEGLEAAHALGVIHRDLKPENVFLERGDEGSVKLLDFGISKRSTSEKASAEVSRPDRVSLTMDGKVLGTPYYMAPEQATGRRDLDQRADLWAVGVILYEMLTGRRPFVGSSARQVLLRVCNQAPTPIERYVRQLPPGLKRVVDRALAKNVDERYPSARAMLDDLEIARHSLLMLDRGATPRSSELRTLTRWGLSSAVLGALSFFAWMALSGSHHAYVRRTPASAIASTSAPPDASTQRSTSGNHVASLVVHTDPPQATVRIDGQIVHEMPWRGRAGQRCEITVSAPGYKTERKAIRISQGPQTFVVSLARNEVVRPKRPRRKSSSRESNTATLYGGLELKKVLH